MEENKCIFCAIASKAISANIVYEDDLLIGVLDINPATKGHVIIIPKKHYNSLYELGQQEYLYMLSVSRAVGYAVMMSQGSINVDMLYTQELAKGNFTPHAIIHVLPRYNDDTINYTWQPQKQTPEELSAIGDSIRSAVEKVKMNEEVKKPEQQVIQQKERPQEEKSAPPAEKPPELKRRTVII